jgi:undecaprenyl-diphosphatase
MTPLEPIILGIVQGITEFLPISSTAHLILVPWLFQWQDPGLTFDVMLHAGTLLALLLYFWKDWLNMLAGLLPGHFVPNQDQRLGSGFLLIIIAGTIPAALAGAFFEKAVETTLRSPLIIAGSLILLALLLWLAERVTRKARPMASVSFFDGLIVGLAQIVALIPGVSRSGITMTAGLFRGLTREAAARFSFLLSAPVIGGATVKKLLELRHTGIEASARMPMLLGFLASFIAGYLTIRFLLRYLQRNTLYLFVGYRIILGVVIVVLIYFAGFQP